MLSGPICAMVWEGRDAVKTGRSRYNSVTEIVPRLTAIALLGATNPLASAPGTIRGDFAIVGPLRNLFRIIVIIAYSCIRTLAAMFATALMPWRAPRRRSIFGSTRERLSRTNNPNMIGSTKSRQNDQRKLVNIQARHSNKAKVYD